MNVQLNVSQPTTPNVNLKLDVQEKHSSWKRPLLYTALAVAGAGAAALAAYQLGFFSAAPASRPLLTAYTRLLGFPFTPASRTLLTAQTPELAQPAIFTFTPKPTCSAIYDLNKLTCHASRCVQVQIADVNPNWYNASNS